VGETSGVGDALDVGRVARVRRRCVAVMAAAVVLTATSACSLRGQMGDPGAPARTGAGVDPGIEWHPPDGGVVPPTVTTPGSGGRATSQDETPPTTPLRGVPAAYG